MYYPNYDSTGVYIHTNNVWEDRALGPHQQQRCSNVSYARSQVRGPHNHIFVSQTIYFTLLHSLKTRLFINPVLNNPNPNPNPNPNTNRICGMDQHGKEYDRIERNGREQKGAEQRSNRIIQNRMVQRDPASHRVVSPMPSGSLLKT